MRWNTVTPSLDGLHVHLQFHQLFTSIIYRNGKPMMGGKWGCAGKCMFQGMSASVREDAGGRGRDKVERVTR